MTERSLRLAFFLGLLAFLAACSSPEEEAEERTAEFHVHNAQGLYDGGHYQQALDQFNKALEISPSDPAALVGRAWSRLFLGEGLIMNRNTEGPVFVQRALEEFEELAERDFDENQYMVFLGRGKAHAILGDLYRRRAEMLEAEDQRMPPSQARDERIRAAKAQTEAHYHQADQFLHRVLADERSKAAEDNLTALIELAWISVNREDYRGALLYAERYLEQVRRSKELWVASIQKYPRDKAIWEAKLAGAVQKEVACRDLIASTLIQLGQYEKAEDELQHIIYLDPDFGDAYLRRGIVRDELGQKQSALEDFDNFLRRAVRIELADDDPRVLEAVRRQNAIRKELGLEPAAPLTSEKDAGE